MSYGVSESKIAYRCQAAALPRSYNEANVLVHYESGGRPRADEPHFVYVGRLSLEKGLDDLFDAFSAVHKTNPKARLDLVGSGPLAATLKSQVTALGIGDAVAFLGTKSLDEISLMYLNRTALVLPSHSEPWGLVVNESLSYGCPVVVSNACGCMPDLVLDGWTGYSFEVGNVEALASAMRSVVENSNDRLVVARKCLEVISNYTPERAATQILDGCLRMAGGKA